MARKNRSTSKVGFERTIAKVNAIASIGRDAEKLMKEWRKILEADNKYGVMNSIAGDDSHIPPVTYRPARKSAKWSAVKQRALKKKSGIRGRDEFHESIYNNLTSSQYRRLDGPPLAPRGMNSRIITNYRSAHGYTGTHPNMKWFAVGAWFDILNTKGEPFMIYHFEGSGRNKKRDHRGLRADGRAKIRAATRKWIIDGLSRRK